jgi:drug/metabolite transporter (DMT)-like permease
MKFFYFGSMALTVLSNVIYHFCQKEISSKANPLVSLMATYATGLILTLICFPMFYANENIIQSAKALNWASFALGAGIVGLELGFLLAYRAGWNLSLGALYSNVLVTIVLLPVGLFFYKEILSGKQVVGLILSIAGLILLGKK